MTRKRDRQSHAISEYYLRTLVAMIPVVHRYCANKAIEDGLRRHEADVFILQSSSDD